MIAAAAAAAPDRTIDIRAHICPMTWVRVKLALEELAAGQVLEVLLQGDEPVRNVPKSAAAEGNEVVSLGPAGADHRLLLRKGPSPR